jgi:hypothetical protein
MEFHFLASLSWASMNNVSYSISFAIFYDVEAGMVAIQLLKAMCAISDNLKYIVSKSIESMDDQLNVKSVLLQRIIHHGDKKIERIAKEYKRKMLI